MAYVVSLLCCTKPTIKHITQTTQKWIGIYSTDLSKELKHRKTAWETEQGILCINPFKAQGVVPGSIYVEYHRNASEYASNVVLPWQTNALTLENNVIFLAGVAAMQVQRVAISALRVELISLLSTEQMWMSLYLDYLYEPPCSTCSSFNSSSRG